MNIDKMNIELSRDEVQEAVLDHIKKLFPMPAGYIYEIERADNLSSVDVSITKPKPESNEDQS